MMPVDPKSNWQRAVDEILRSEYAISLFDVGLSEDDVKRLSNDEPDPRAFVDWFALKYDLTSYVDIGVHRPQTQRT